MPIEFVCPQCQKLLRVPDQSAGQQAKCPSCGGVTTIPSASPAAPPSPSFATTNVPPPMPNFGPPPAGTFDPGNPYAAPASNAGTASTVLPRIARDRVQAPAIAMIVVASISAVLYVIFTIAVLVVALGGINQQQPEAVFNFVVVALYGWGLILSIVVIVGANKMRKLESYTMAMTATILLMIPCNYPCCVLGLPFGIWSLVVLLDDNVRRSFQS
ncbi:MAG: hypothetical protein JSS27_12140 [Planctomycetes bacterium]|nr:hypothetical protein [Planctomycetota bacterium]